MQADTARHKKLKISKQERSLFLKICLKAAPVLSGCFTEIYEWTRQIMRNKLAHKPCLGCITIGKKDFYMNYLWGFMILIGVVFAAFNGTLPEVTEAAISSAKEAVALCITMMGVMSFWVGIMRIAENAGIIEGATKMLKPFLRFLFPNIPKDHPANKYIATNMIANVFGLGWAATPAGLKAMEELEKLEEERRKAQTEPEGIHRRRERNGNRRGYQGNRSVGRWRIAVPSGVASNEMCTFLIINISSLQLVSVNMIAYRSQYGSVNPAAVVGPGIVATMVSTLAAVLFCKVMELNQRN